jgi:uncharacterized membrane protein YkvA (DUF1232 family)
MQEREFLESKWMRKAARPDAAPTVRAQFPNWIRQVGNGELVEKAKRLWAYFKSGQCSNFERILIVAGLLYLISPLDAVPDFIPVVGWLDDLGVAAMILTYLGSKAGEDSEGL